MFISIKYDEGVKVGRTFAITKPLAEEAINICEVEIYGYSFTKTNSMLCKLCHQCDMK